MMPGITFSGWRDRFTWALVEARWVWFFAVVMGGLTVGILQPEVGPLPEWTVDLSAATAILGPPLFVAGIRFARWLRKRNAVEVFHINAVTDDTEKYLVPPDVWREKSVEGADPYPVNGASAWAVREFDWHPETEDLIVRGVWLSELEDRKLLTSKDHMESCYGKLTEAYISLGIMRDSVSELGADLQSRLINRIAEARERGENLDKTAVKEVFEQYEERAEDVTETDLPTLDADDLPDEWAELTDPEPTADAGEKQPAATDGGEP